MISQIVHIVNKIIDIASIMVEKVFASKSFALFDILVNVIISFQGVFHVIGEKNINFAKK